MYRCHHDTGSNRLNTGTSSDVLVPLRRGSETNSPLMALLTSLLNVSYGHSAPNTSKHGEATYIGFVGRKQRLHSSVRPSKLITHLFLLCRRARQEPCDSQLNVSLRDLVVLQRCLWEPCVPFLACCPVLHLERVPFIDEMHERLEVGVSERRQCVVRVALETVHLQYLCIEVLEASASAKRTMKNRVAAAHTSSAFLNSTWSGYASSRSMYAETSWQIR